MGCQNPFGHSGCPHSHSHSLHTHFSLAPHGIFPLIPAHLHKQGPIIPIFPGNRRKSPLAAPGAARPNQTFSCWDCPDSGRLSLDFWEVAKPWLSKPPWNLGWEWGQFQRLRSQILISHEFQRSDPYENHGAKHSRKGEKSKSHKTPRWSESRVSLWSFQEFLINNSREGKSF